MDNGLVVIIKRKSEIPAVSINIKVKAGVSQEKKFAGSGITHFIEHLIFKGTKKMRPGVIEKEIKSYGGYINASTSPDTTSFYTSVNKENCEKALEILCDSVMNPLFDEKEIEKERNVILNEINMRDDDPSTKIIQILFEKAYLESPYRYPIIGYAELLKKINRQDIAEYHSKYYIPNNMVVCIVGDFEPSSVYESVKKTFGSYQRGFGTYPNNNRDPEQIAERLYTEYRETNLGYIAFGYHTVSLMDGDLFSLDVLGMLLGSGDSSRLNKSLVKDKRLLHSVAATNYTPFYPGLFIITGIGDPQNLEKCKKEIENEIKNIASNGASQAEYEKAKANVISAYLENMQTMESQSENMAQSQILTGDPYFAERYIEGVQNLKLDDIKRVAEIYLKPENRTAIFINPISMRPEKKEIFPEKETKASKYLLPNGLRVIVKERNDLPIASCVLACLGGLRAENETNPGICNIASNMLLKGTKTRKEYEIKEAMENVGGSINSFSGMNSFGIVMEFLSNDMDQALGIMEDVVKNPDFPEDEINKLKEKVISKIKREDDDVFQSAIAAFKKNMFKTHPYSHRIAGEIESVQAFNKNDLEKFYNSLLNPEAMVICVTGDVNAEDVYKKMRQKFSTLKKPDHAINPVKEPTFDSAEEKIINMPKKQAFLGIGFKGVDFDNEEKYVLEIISSIMSGSDGRLFETIRNQVGLSYAQGAYSMPGVDPGYILLYAATGARDIPRVKEIIFREMASIKKQPVSDEELKAAKSSLIGFQTLSLQTNSSLAFTMAMDELYGLGYENYKFYNEKIEKCTKDDIISVANKYFDKDKSISVIVLPEG